MYKKNKGFTLVELIIYLAITSVILVSITTIILTILSGQTKNQVGSELNYNLQFLTNALSRDIKKSNRIISLSTSTLILAQQSEAVTYYFDRDNFDIWRQYNLESPVKMNTDLISVKGDFYNNSFSNKSKNVSVVLELGEFDLTKMSDFVATTSATLSVELRGKK